MSYKEQEGLKASQEIADVGGMRGAYERMSERIKCVFA